MRVGDIVIDGTTAIVAGWAGADGGSGPATLVNLTEPATPRIVGSMTGMGSRLALAGNVLFSTERSFLKGLPTPLGGVRSTALATVAVIRQITPSAIVTEGAADVTESDVNIEAAVVPSTYEIGTAEIRILRNGTVIETLPATIAGSLARAVWPARRPVDRKAVYTAVAAIDKDSDRPLTSVPVQVPLVQITFIDRRGQETFAPPTSDPQPTVTLDPFSRSTSSCCPAAPRRKCVVSGIVTDPLADIVAEQAADIREVTARGNTYPVTLVREPATPWPVPTRSRAASVSRSPFRSGTGATRSSSRPSMRSARRGTTASRSSPSVAFDERLHADGLDVAPKFLDPFTVQAAAPEADGRPAILLHQGPGAGGPRHATGAGCTELAGVLGNIATFWDRTCRAGRAACRRVDPAVRESRDRTALLLALSIVGEPLEFVETRSGQRPVQQRRAASADERGGHFSLTELPRVDVADTVRVEVEQAAETVSGTLTETGPGTKSSPG